MPHSILLNFAKLCFIQYIICDTKTSEFLPEVQNSMKTSLWTQFLRNKEQSSYTPHAAMCYESIAILDNYSKHKLTVIYVEHRCSMVGTNSDWRYKIKQYNLWKPPHLVSICVMHLVFKLAKSLWYKLVLCLHNNRAGLLVALYYTILLMTHGTSASLLVQNAWASIQCRGLHI